jgi:chaperonin GroEL (HSP60 family)
MESHVLM